MRITGGQYRGRVLQSPKDDLIRPTSDKVRQAVFNILNSRGLVKDAVVLDAFCGTGALGLEALSHFAQCCTFMDKSPVSLELCKSNFAALKIAAKCSFVLKDSVKPGPVSSQSEPADLVFLDPPYRKGLIEASLAALEEGGWMSRTAHILIESEREYDPNLLGPMGYDIFSTKDYGDTRIALLQKNGV